MRQEDKKKIKARVLEQMDLSRSLEDQEIMTLIDETILQHSRENYIAMKDKTEMQKDIFNALRRLDVLQELIDDNSISEIMVNGADDIFVEQYGGMKKWHKCFESENKLQDVIQQIVSGANRIVNESSPMVDARLPDGSRVNVVLPPIALNGPVLTIRKFPEKAMTMQQMIDMGSITSEAAEFLQKLVVAGYNIFISGGTGSGKTTFLNALSEYIPSEERIITIEDAAELQIQNIPNLVRLEVRNPNLEGEGEINIRSLIKSALRMRPSRIIVGEVRDGAALDMLHAMNTGHDGSISTGHANTTGDMLSRLEMLVLMAADLPLEAVRRQLATALDIVIQLGRLRDKSRKVLEISEVVGYSEGEIELNTLFTFREEGDSYGKVQGVLKKTNQELIHRSKLIKAGLAY